MFNYEVYSDEEIDSQRKKLSAGICNFTVVSAIEKLSKTSGLPMLELKLHVWDCHGVEGTVFDYLVSSEKMAWKLRDFCKSIGDISIYKEKRLSSFTASHKSGKADL